MNSIARVSRELPAIRLISYGRRMGDMENERRWSDDSHVVKMNSDTRQLNHLVVHSDIGSLIEAPRRANCAWVDNVGFFTVTLPSFLFSIRRFSVRCVLFVGGKYASIPISEYQRQLPARVSIKVQRKFRDKGGLLLCVSE